MAKDQEATVRLRKLHDGQWAIKNCPARKRIARCGRRFGKTILGADEAVDSFLKGGRVLYSAPTSEQTDAFWKEVKRALREPLTGGLYKSETLRIIEVPNTDIRIKAKTAWNADTLRGDWGTLEIFDEWQLTCEDAWEEVGAPMLMDHGGRALFFYTPPNPLSKSTSKAKDPMHAAKMFKNARAMMETDPKEWGAFSYGSLSNPYLDQQAVQDITKDMTRSAYLREIDAIDLDDAPGALWTRALIDSTRVNVCPELSRVAVSVDPPGGQTECGIMVCGIAKIGRDVHGYVLMDRSLAASPNVWARTVITAYNTNEADVIVGEKNFGGDMVEATLQQAAKDLKQNIRYKNVSASRGKAIRAEPIVAMWEQGRLHMVGTFPNLEDEMTMWVPFESKTSPNRLDALVWAFTELMPGTNSFDTWEQILKARNEKKPESVPA